jgi:hypothetical protein
MRKETAALVKELTRRGLDVSKSGSGHWVVRGADGRRITTFAATPSDRRALLNARAYLRKAGIAI